MNVGAQLREAREARRLSLTRLAAITRINARVLEGLERNDLSAMPARPYARGFVAAYARETGLDPDQTVRAYFAQFEEPPPAIPAQPEPRSPESGRWRMPAAVLGALALIVVAVVVARTINFTRPADFPATETSPAATQPAPVGTTGAGAPAPAPQMVSGPGSQTVTSRAVTGRSVGTPSLATSRGDLVVTLEADAPSWVAATVDGERRLYQILQPGARHTLRAGRSVVLRVGDAGAVRWSVNGRPAAPMGGRGEVRTVKLTPAGADPAVR
jgi:cytoskeletal protein RodZ